MITYRQIDDFSIGDTYKLTRTTDAYASTVSAAFLTIKSDLGLADQDAEIAISISETGTANGQVINNVDGTATLNFIIVPTASYMMDRLATYLYDIHLNLTSGEKYQIEQGKLFTTGSVTQVH